MNKNKYFNINYKKYHKNDIISNAKKDQTPFSVRFPNTKKPANMTG
jgi:hypothetical protein